MIAEAPPITEKPPVAVRLQQALALFRQGHVDAAESLYADILCDDPGEPNALHIMGLIAEQRGDFDMADRLIWRSVQMHPHSRAYLNLGVVRTHRGMLNDSIACYRQAIALEPTYPEAWANLLFALDTHPFATPTLALETRRAFDAAVCAPLSSLWQPHENDRDPDRKLRVGYVSSDFRMSHSAAMAFHWIARHDSEAVEVFCYSTYEGQDATDAPFRERTDVWCEVGHLEPHELVAVIRDDAIDILVDLSGASKGGRPLTFALKPAPIQVGGWGYSSGLGIRAMDYLVSDPVAMPQDHADRYPERLLEMPCIVAYSPPATLPDVGPSPEARNGYRTYGYLGRPIKLTDAVFAAWAEILRRDPTGRLLLKSGQYHDRAMRERVLHGMGALGVDMGRVEVRGVTSRYEHLEAYRDVDVCLDSFPQSGGITVCDALLMGVPTVTLLGEMAPSRTSASILVRTGWGTGVCESVDAYIETAMSKPLPSRELIRQSLMSSILVDHTAYARLVEERYRMIWREWVSKERA